MTSFITEFFDRICYTETLGNLLDHIISLDLYTYSKNKNGILEEK